MATSLLVGLSARLLQWQNPVEFGAQFLNALRRPSFFKKSGQSAVSDTKLTLGSSFLLDQRNNMQSP
jgi:hypothetical protein